MTQVRRYSSAAVVTDLTAGISAVDTSLTVSNPGGYPAAPFTIQVESEIIRVGAKSGAVFSSLTRGFDGSAASAHSLGSVVEHVAAADDFDWRWTEKRLQRPRGPVDEEFSGSSLANFTQLVVTGTTTWTEGPGTLGAKFASQTSSDCNAVIKSLGILAAPPIEVSTASRWMGPWDNYLMFGPLLCTGTTSTHSVVWNMTYIDAGSGLQMSIRSGTFTNVSANHVTTRFDRYGGPWLYQKVVWVTANTFSAGWSLDGVTWFETSNFAVTMTPTHLGLGVSTWGSASTKLAAFDYLRVREI